MVHYATKDVWDQLSQFRKKVCIGNIFLLAARELELQLVVVPGKEVNIIPPSLGKVRKFPGAISLRGVQPLGERWTPSSFGLCIPSRKDFNKPDYHVLWFRKIRSSDSLKLTMLIQSLRLDFLRTKDYESYCTGRLDLITGHVCVPCVYKSVSLL